MPELFSVREASVRLGVSRSTVRKLVREGKLRVVRINWQLLLPSAEIYRLASRGTGSYAEAQHSNEVCAHAQGLNASAPSVGN